MPSGNAMETEMATATVTRASVCIDSVQRPAKKQNASVNTVTMAALRLIAKKASRVATAIRAKAGG
ncbi:hypothetical protein D3C86_1649740 [compost metagenome]